MKKFLNVLQRIGLALLLLFISLQVAAISIRFRDGTLITDMSQGFGIFVGFVVVFIWYVLSLKLLKRKLGLILVSVIILVPFLYFLTWKGVQSSYKFNLKVLPFYLTLGLAFVSGYLFAEKNKKLLSALFLVFPLILSVGIYDLWVHKIEYGTFYGEVSDGKVVDFEMTNKSGELISNKSLAGKYVLFDFWYRTCGPCWVKFPDLQRIHEEYADHPDVEVYAINRPMDYDKPGQLYTSVEKKNYTFPVLAGTQEIMDTFGVYVYPTVILLDKNGTVIFMGELEDAEKKLKGLLNSESRSR